MRGVATTNNLACGFGCSLLSFGAKMEETMRR